jgi:hypothetical protein
MMIDIQNLFLYISTILLIPLLWKIRLLITKKITLENFFNKGELFSIEVEKLLTSLGIIFFLVFLFLVWYETPELR